MRLARDLLSAKLIDDGLHVVAVLRLARDLLSAKLSTATVHRPPSCGWRAISYRLN